MLLMLDSIHDRTCRLLIVTSRISYESCYLLHGQGNLHIATTVHHI